MQTLRRVGVAIAAGAVAFLALYHLSAYPLTWFDEGSHLHVPKTLLRHGVYADYSSDGYRYFGPTLGVGPTVLLPVAAVFRLFGVGLLQARLVISGYLAAAVWLFIVLARRIDGDAVAWTGLGLLVGCRSVAFFETGRQVLGEVPALCLLLAAFVVWFSAWDGAPFRLVAAGLLFGAASVTKYQILVVLVPTIGLAAIANLLYYRATTLRVFAWPALILGAVFAAWQAVLVVYLGPQTAAENFVAFRQATAGAAAVFSPPLMKRAIAELLSFKTFGGCLGLGLIYGLFVARPRSREGQWWSVLLLFVLINLAWYVFASIGWVRYAFAGLALGSLFVARLFVDLVRAARRMTEPQRQRSLVAADGMIAVGLAWPALIIMTGIAATALPIVRPPLNAPQEMASYLNSAVPTDVVVETWEPELGFLTDHDFHYPPTGTLNAAVRHIWSGGPPPRARYDAFAARPQYVVVGGFGRWVDVYAGDTLATDYTLLKSIGGYQLYARRRP